MSIPESVLSTARLLQQEVSADLKKAFVGKDEVIDLLTVGLVGAENVFLHGPPGTAKSALVHAFARQVEGRTFDYLLTRFTEPSELFGPFDLRRLRDGELSTNTEGMLPEADLVFLDELFNASSAILNALLTALNERIFRRGRETRPLPALVFVGASNHLPEEESLKALFDRFPLRVHCANVPDHRLPEVLAAGWQLDNLLAHSVRRVSVAEVRTLQQAIPEVALDGVRPAYAELLLRLRQAGLSFSDRRAVRLQRVVAASALLAGRREARLSDFWILRHTWDTEGQREVLSGILDSFLRQQPADTADHPRARPEGQPDPDELARLLDGIEAEGTGDDAARLRRVSRLSALATRLEWVTDEPARQALRQRLEKLW